MFKQLASKQWTHIASYATCIWCQLLRNRLVSIHCLSQNNRFPFNWHQNNEHRLHHMQPVYWCQLLGNLLFSIYCLSHNIRFSSNWHQNTDKILHHMEPVFDATCLEFLKFQHNDYCKITHFHSTGIKTMNTYCITWNL
jgi:hypothetical protein